MALPRHKQIRIAELARERQPDGLTPKHTLTEIAQLVGVGHNKTVRDYLPADEEAYRVEQGSLKPQVKPERKPALPSDNIANQITTAHNALAAKAEAQRAETVVRQPLPESPDLRTYLQAAPRSLGQVAEYLGVAAKDALAAVQQVAGWEVDEATGGFCVAPDPEPELEDDLQGEIAEDRRTRRLSTERDAYKKKYEQVLKDFEDSEARLQAALNVKEAVAPLRIEPDLAVNGGQAAAIWLASDWHVGERVDPSTINWLNKYNPDIATRRAENYFRNGLKLVRKERQDVTIDTLILWVGGDLVTGYLHDELEESNYLSPTEESLLAKRLIGGGLKMLVEDGGFKRIVVVCSYGNHGRTTKKRRHSTGYKNSYEWMLYNELAHQFAGEPVLDFRITNGYLNYVEVFGKVLRFHHGDNIGYQGGVGGVTIPLNKFIARTNQQRWADMDAIGHFHQQEPYAPWRRFIKNGSLIGFNAYAQSLAASPEPPQQVFQLLDAKRGFTIYAPISVNENDSSESRSMSYPAVHLAADGG